MGLAFSIGTAASIFSEPFAARIQDVVKKVLGYSIPLETPFEDDAYWSEELGWSGWDQLQERAILSLGEENIPQLLAMEAWQGVYLPVDMKPIEISIIEEEEPLQCGSLPLLVKELEQFAEKEGLPIDKEGLEEFWEKYLDDDFVDEDMDIQTYLQLMLTAQIALAHNLPLWIVK